MSDSNFPFPAILKELCFICYKKNLYHPLISNQDVKRCSNTNCNGSRPIYVSGTKNKEYVRDFQNNSTSTFGSVEKCKHNNDLIDNCQHYFQCTFANNDTEYFVWNKMKDLRISSISEIYSKYVEPYTYTAVYEKNALTYKIASVASSKTPHMINHVPQSSMENDVIQQDEKRKLYFCWFCFKQISGEPDIQPHIDGRLHNAYYEADKKRRWYFKMPASQKIILCTQYECHCDHPHSKDEYQEMLARIQFRNFISSVPLNFPENKIYPWPKWMEIYIPKFPSNINCYQNPIQIFVNLSVNYPNCEKLQIYLLDDESRIFFKLIKTNENQIMEAKYNNELMIIPLKAIDKRSDIEFGIKFNPNYSSTYIQTLEFQLTIKSEIKTFCKRIRVDVGTNEHINQFKKLYDKYSEIISRKLTYQSYLPFDSNEIERRDILNGEILSSVFKVIPNLKWVNTTVENYNYFGWMTDMMVLEELEQRLLLSKLTYNGIISIQNHIVMEDHYFANDGKLFGVVEFHHLHDWSAREIIIKNVSNCYLVVKSISKSVLFECELVDSYRYKYESRTTDGVTICLSKQTVETLRVKDGDKLEGIIHFCYDRLVFNRRHESLKNIPTYDKLAYNPLVCPSFTRLPYGDDESKIEFISCKNLNSEQKKLPLLVLRKLKNNEIPLPFILNGAFGTGKSWVFAETVISILRHDPRSFTLICTRSYSAGQLYLDIFKEHIPQFLYKIKILKSDHKKNFENEKDVIYNKDFNTESFCKNSVFITTLDNAVDSLTPFLKFLKSKSLFNYIFIDEAAQILEVDAVMVYQFGNKNSKFIFAGDICQTRPDLYNRELKKFSIPIICRLYNTYKLLTDYTICLRQVYRTHPKIVEYLTSAIYYKTPLISLMTPSFPQLQPMKFIDCNGCVEVFDKQYSSFKNEEETRLILNEINLLIFKSETRIDKQRILVCTPFFAQVKLIRDILRKKKLADVIVEQPSNIQGREFDAVFISTVLTEDGDPNIPILHPTFHTNRNLINLVISRAKHFIVVVGDSKSLVSELSSTHYQWSKFIEECRKQNEEFI